MPVSHVAAEITLVIGAVMTLAFALVAPRSRQPTAALLAAGSLAAAAIITAFQMADLRQSLTFSGTWANDGAADVATLLILGLTALVVAMSPEWFRSDGRHGEYYAILLFSAAGAIMMAGAADTLELVVGVLLSSVTGYTLAAYHRASAASAEAGMKYFLVGALANVGLLVGVTLLFGVVGSTLYGEVAAGLDAAGGQRAALVGVAVLVTVGLGFKMGAVPVHSWVPDVAQGGPAPVAAFVTVVPKVGALVALARLLPLLSGDIVGWRPLVALMAAATMTVGNLAALWQDDLRRLLGWSAVSQSGFALMGVVALERSDLAVPAILFFLTAYGVANMAAFGVVVELRGRTALDDYRGLSATHPWLAIALALAVLSFVGIPPLAGFTGKLTLFAASIEAGYTWLAVVAVANTVVSLFYYLRVVGPAYFHAPTRSLPALGRWAASATLTAAGAVVAVGLASELLLDGFEGAAVLP